MNEYFVPAYLIFGVIIGVWAINEHFKKQPKFDSAALRCVLLLIVTFFWLPMGFYGAISKMLRK